MIFEGTKNQFFFGLELTRAGICLPDVSVYVELCEILGISLNEFLAGEDIEIANVEKNRKTP